ncbi:hypothetical protein [Nocardia sp. NBC_01329]|uniref:hypothetical protein n=1 Tax=Nocardia sp. NBC_01329 TaxID=2903594 RepID=UPI002E0FB208|nr:hypothetical protein OG405_20210 [Nocardia sp. NBC_01329]
MSATRIRPLGTVMPATKHASAVSTPLVPAPVKSVQRPPCADVPDSWDLDSGTPESWHTAIRTCYSCPLFEHCSKLAQTLIERGDAPRAMIWAGIAYDNSGNVVENLDRHRAVPIDHKRPMRIIRNGPRPARPQSAVAAPKRHLVLGHPLKPTETVGV